MNTAINWQRNLWTVWLSQFLSLAGFGMCGPFIPLFMKDSLGITDDAQRGAWVAVFTFAGLLSLCAANFMWGMLADRFGRKLMLLRASYGTALLYPLMVFSPNIYWLIGFRALSALFTGTVNPAQTLLVSTTPKERHGYVLGVLSTAVWSGNLTGYLLGGIVVELWGYTAAFMSCSMLYFTSGLLIHFLVKENFKAPEKSNSKERKKLSGEIMVPGVIALLLMFMLMGAGRRIDQPFVAMLVEMIHGESGAALYTGIISAGGAVGGVIAGFGFGTLSDRYPPEKMIVPVVSIAAFCAVWQGVSPNIWSLGIARFFYYFVAGGMQPMLLVMLSRLISPERKGTFFGWSASVNLAGGLGASAISGLIAYNLGVRAIFIAGGILLILMLVPGMRLFRVTGTARTTGEKQQ
ncbi:MAG: MFS transporter [Lentisphaeria bacterium]|nr:MFS transporter [Lentisphaeria bacterium]